MSRLIAGIWGIVLFLFNGTLWAQELDCQTQHCVGVVDVGSTGSRFHVYTYDRDTHNAPIHIKEQWSRKIKPGLATLDNNQATVDTYLTNLVAGVPTASSMPVYFYATAGMRLLSETKQAEMFSYVTHWFNQQNQWVLQAAKVITGQQEGVFAWLAVNYQLGNLEDSSKPLTGVMDMGGGSVQIVFPVAQDRSTVPQNLQSFELYGRHFNLFSRSFLGLGQTELSHQFLNQAHCFSVDYPLPSGLLGQGNAFQCRRDISSLINTVHRVKRTVQRTLRHNIVKTWYLLGGVTNLAQNPRFGFTNNQFDSVSMLNQGNEKVCHQTWSSLKAAYPKDDYLYSDCLNSAYYFALMVDGYGIDQRQALNYLPSTTPGDWTLGVVLKELAA